jgi:hypothetical protein
LISQFETTHVTGFYNEESFVDSPLFMPYPDYGLEVHLHLSLMHFIEIKSAGDHSEFPLAKKIRPIT